MWSSASTAPIAEAGSMEPIPPQVNTEPGSANQFRTACSSDSLARCVISAVPKEPVLLFPLPKFPRCVTAGVDVPVVDDCDAV